MVHYGYVYVIKNNINGKLYIGVTRVGIKKRWAQHKHNAIFQKKKTHLARAFKKYGLDAFDIRVIKTCYNADQMYNAEIYFIKHFNSNDRKFGYNNSTGGEISTLGMKHSDETRIKIGLKSKGHAPNSTSYKKGRISIISEETRRKIGESNRGKIVSESVKDKIREKRKLQIIVHSQETKDKISRAHMGKIITEEHRKNISLCKIGNKNMLGKKHSVESKAKMSEALKGKKHTEQHRINRSIAVTSWWAKRKQLQSC